MQRNAKSLKRNNEAGKGILIAPLKLPRFSSVVEIFALDFFIYCLQHDCRLRAKIRGTDGKHFHAGDHANSLRQAR